MSLKIIQIIPGSGDQFYCENCLRDAALAQEWRKQGQDAVVVPLYLPLSGEQWGREGYENIFFGGINVYLQQKFTLFRKSPRWLDWVFDRPWLLRRAAGMGGMTDPVDLAQTALSMLRGRQGKQRKELDRLLSGLSRLDKPDVVCLSNVLLCGLAEGVREKLSCPIACLLQDEDEFLDELPDPYRGQAWELIAEQSQYIDLFVSPSRYYAEKIQAKLGLAKQEVHVVPAGIDPQKYKRPTEFSKAPVIGYLSRFCQSKGLDLLAESFVRLKKEKSFEDVRLRIAGGMTGADVAFVNQVKRELRPFSDSVDWLVPFRSEDRYDFLRGLTVLSVPERRSPACGLYAIEAMAMGIPVVVPEVGAFTEYARQISQGLRLTQPGDADDLTRTLGEHLVNLNETFENGRAGQEQALKYFHIQKTAKELIELFEQIPSKTEKGFAR